MTQRPREKPLVLAIDDHPSILRFIQIGLEMRGIDTITTTSGRRALDLTASSKPDLVVLDIVMPDMNGFEALKRLRELSQVPVIVMSADPANRDKAMELGAADFVPKPFNTDYLVKRITTLLSR